MITSLRSLLLLRSCHRSYQSTKAANSVLPPTPSTIAVDDLGIPLSPPYSILDYIPTPTPLSRERLSKLHKLAALNPPSTKQGWDKLKSLDGLVAIVDQIRNVDTSAVAHITDARIRAEAEPLDLFSSPKVGPPSTMVRGEKLLELAQVRQGSYYVARTPAGIRGKKRSGTQRLSQED